MTEPRVEVPVRYSAERVIQRIHGSLVLSGVRVEYPPNPESVGQPVIPFGAFARLEGTEGEYLAYDAGTHGEGAVIEFASRAPAALRAIPAVSVHVYEPEGTTVGWRVVLGGADVWWDGGAWDAATDDELHWNTSADLASNLSAASMADAATGIGFRAALRTAREDRTPRVYGVRMFWAVAPVQTQLDEVRQADPRDELAAVISAALKSQEVSESEETTGAAIGGSVLDYSSGIGGRYRSVSSVDAVYNIDTDPGMVSPLSGAWDSGAKTYTLDTPVGDAVNLHIKLRWQPWAQMAGGEADLLLVNTEKGPMALVEVVTPLGSVHRAERHVIYRPDGSARSVRAAFLEDVTVEVKIIGEYDADVRALQRAVVAWARDASSAAAGQGRLLTLPSTAHRQGVRMLPLPANVARRGDLWQTTHRLMADKLPVFLAEGVEHQGVAEIPVDA